MRPTRRAVLGSSLAGLAALSAGHGISDPSPPAPARPLAPDAPDGLFLTWQRDPTTTMTVQWVAPRGGGAGVHFGPRPLSGAGRFVRAVVKPFPGTDLAVFRAELTGLSPGREYEFRTGTCAATFPFRTMPARATGPITFVSGGDCGVNPQAAATNALAARQEPHFALLGGDLAYDNGRSPETFLAFLRNYSARMVDLAGRLIPLVACIGNHELNGAVGATREAAPAFLSVFDGLFRDATYAALDFGDYLSLVLLDSGHVAPAGGAQADWLGAALRAREGVPHLFAANHVPAYPSARDPGEAGAGNREFWCPLFERHGVDAVLEHHDHTFKRTHPLTGGRRDKYGVLYLGDGSWGPAARPGPSGEAAVPGGRERGVPPDGPPAGGRPTVPRRTGGRWAGRRCQREHGKTAGAPGVSEPPVPAAPAGRRAAPFRPLTSRPTSWSGRGTGPCPP